MKKKKKTPQQEKERWRKKCVELAKKISKRRDNLQCQWCGKKDGKMDGSHVFPEGKHKAMSADVDNIKALCFHCHYRWHESPVEGVEWFKKKFPERYKELIKRSRSTTVCTLEFWQKKYEELEKEYES